MGSQIKYYFKFLPIGEQTQQCPCREQSYRMSSFLGFNKPPRSQIEETQRKKKENEQGRNKNMFSLAFSSRLPLEITFLLK